VPSARSALLVPLVVLVLVGLLVPAAARAPGGVDVADARGDVVSEGPSEVGRREATLPPASVDVLRITWAVRGGRLVTRTHLADVQRPHAARGYQTFQEVLAVLSIGGNRRIRLETRVIGSGQNTISFNYPPACDSGGARVDDERDLVVQWVGLRCLNGATRATVVTRARLKVQHLRDARTYRGWLDDIPVRRFRISS
jgi:hypothetical protein